MEFLFVTGMSGAGKTNAAHALEDLGYYCIDNIPPVLVNSIVDLSAKGQFPLGKIAIVTDFRGGEAFYGIDDVFKQLTANSVPFKVLFLDASDTELERRYNETRRRHPLCDLYRVPVKEAILKERELFMNLRAKANFVVDTTNITAGQLKKQLLHLFSNQNKEGLNITCMSFGFKYGAVTESNLVFDARCLPNPYYVEQLKHHTGLDKDVVDYIMQFESAQTYVQKMLDFVEYTVPLYRDEGKSQLVIAVGCTGGKHRSVALTEMIYNALKDKNFCVSVIHRDIEKH